jgi:hypothetical protein
MPVSAVLASHEVMLTIQPGQHGRYCTPPVYCALAPSCCVCQLTVLAPPTSTSTSPSPSPSPSPQYLWREPLGLPCGH